MGIVATVAAAIGSAIASAAVAIYGVVSAVIAAVTTAVAAIGSAIYGAVSAVVSGIGAAISTVAAKISAGVSYIVSGISSWVGAIAANIGYYAEMLYGYVQYFARVIHLKTILQVHKIAYIVSKDYRQMMNKVFRKLSEVSEALGLGAQFINLALANARSIILNVSAMMGKSYDLAEVTWLKSLVSFTRKFEPKATRHRTEEFRVSGAPIYRKDIHGKIKYPREIIGYEEKWGQRIISTSPYIDHPEEVIRDIDRWLLRDSVNAGADVQKTVFVTIEKTAEIVNETVQDVVTLRDDIDRFVSDLPKEIREEIEPYTDPIIDKVDGFLEDEYAPFKQKMDAIIDVMDNKQATVKNRVDGIVDRLTRPGDLLRNVDLLSFDQRITQENKISEVAARSNQRQADSLEVQAQPTWEHLEKLRQALEEAPPPPEYIIVERKKPIVPAGQQSREADTWFVGDY